MSKEDKYSFIVAKYDGAETADAALDVIHGLTKEKALKLKDALVITKNEKGKVKLHQTKDDSAGKGFLKGGAIGVLFGVLFGGPVWVLAGVVSGTAVGMLDKGIKNKLVKALGEDMTQDESALAVLVKEADWATVQERMAANNLSGEIVVSEIAPAHMAEVEALSQKDEAADAIPEEVEIVSEETTDEEE